MTEPLDLTVADVHAFVEKINVGRRAIGEEPIATVEFDECEPNIGRRCLSARHLFVRGAGEKVGERVAFTRNAVVLAEAFGVEVVSGRGIRIPDEILRVTSVFDACFIEAPEALEELRDLFVEAGYVEP